MRGSAPPPVALTARGGPDEVGQWLPPQDWPCIAIHAAMLPTGEVLHYSYPDSSNGSRVITWNPSKGTFTDADDITDIFCSGLTFLEDGTVFVAGGNNDQCVFQGRIPVRVANCNLARHRSRTGSLVVRASRLHPAQPRRPHHNSPPFAGCTQVRKSRFRRLASGKALG